MKRRKAETLAESIMSLAAFGVIMAGVCDFMSNQTNFIARTRQRDELMYKAQELASNGIFNNLGNDDITAGVLSTYKPEKDEIEKLENIASFDWDGEKKLTIKAKNSSMDFYLTKEIKN